MTSRMIRMYLKINITIEAVRNSNMINKLGWCGNIFMTYYTIL